MGEGRVWDLGAQGIFFALRAKLFNAWRQKPAPGAKVPHPRPLPSGPIRERASISSRVRLQGFDEKIDSPKPNGRGLRQGAPSAGAADGAFFDSLRMGEDDSPAAPHPSGSTTGAILRISSS